jgi:hypothetical protein
MFFNFMTPRGIVKGVVRPPGGSEKLPTKTPLQKAIRTTVGGLYPPGGARVLHILIAKSGSMWQTVSTPLNVRTVTLPFPTF